MNTKYILHGGFGRAQYPLQENDKFFAEMFVNVPDEVKILGVYFAEREEMVQMRIDQDKEQLAKNSGSKTLDFKIASEETFEQDCQWADVIYLHGGHTAKLMQTLEKFPNIRQMLSGRTIAGDSAGVNVLAQLFYSKKNTSDRQGTRYFAF